MIAARKLEITFIFLIMIGTSMDFILRQTLPDYALLVTISCLSIFAIALYVFQKITYEQIPNVRRDIVKQDTLFRLTPLKNIASTNDPLLIIRFFAAFLVFIKHTSLLLHPSNHLLAGNWVILQGGAHTGMAIFFTLSGFLMGKAFLLGRYELTKQGVLLFYKSRWIRIFPLMFFVATLLIILQYPQVLRFDPLSLIRLFTFNYYGNTIGLNGIGAMWSLSVEFQYYLIAPFVFSIFNEQIKKNKTKGMLIVIATILIFTIIKRATKHYVLVHGLYDPNFFSLVGNLPFFLIGFLFNYIPLTLSEKAAKFITHGGVLLCEICLAFLLISYLQKHTVIYFLCISVLTGFAISALDGIRKMPVILNKSKFSVLNILQMLGVLSYGFYLWHSGIGYIHSHLFPNEFNSHSSYLAEVFIVGMIVLFMSFLSYVLVEDRFNAYKPINKKNLLGFTSSTKLNEKSLEREQVAC